MSDGSEKNRKKIVREFDNAARILCANHDAFAHVLDTYKAKLEQMQDYIGEVPLLVDRAALKPPKGKLSESQKLKRRQAYKASREIIGECRFFFTKKERAIDRHLKHPNWSFEQRVFRLPVDIDSIGTMRWMAAEYKRAIPAIIDKYETAFDKFNRSSEKLPVSFSEYRDKGFDYEMACEKPLSEDELRSLTRQTFRKLRSHYSLRPVPAKPK